VGLQKSYLHPPWWPGQRLRPADARRSSGHRPRDDRTPTTGKTEVVTGKLPQETGLETGSKTPDEQTACGLTWTPP
jgi:hypothetical protein